MDSPTILYGRNSTDDQAEAGTIGNQQTFLRNYAKLYSLNVVGEYWDEGVSGTIPLGDRPFGRDLLQTAAIHPNATVLVYRLDRLGRSLRSLLEAHDQLSAASVAIKSATEPFDTSTSIGKFLFQLLASLAELERATITERTSMGRDRVAKTGKWTGGPIPYGYDLDSKGCLVPSLRMVDHRSESEIAREVITRVANGSSCVLESERLNALNVPAFKRWSSGTEHVASGRWHPDRVLYMVHNPVYAGDHILHGKNGDIVRPVESPLIDKATWDRAQDQLVKNRILATRNARRFYLLRGLMRCTCGCGYVGCGGGNRARGQESRWYRCLSQTGVGRRDGRKCGGKSIPAGDFEALVWADCCEWAQNPGKALELAQQQLRSRLEQAPHLDEQRRTLSHDLAAKEQERARVMLLFRRGKTSLEDTERDLDQIQGETNELRAQLESLRSQQDVSAAFEAQFTQSAALLARVGEQIEAINNGLASEDTGVRSVAEKVRRGIIEQLVSKISIRTHGEGSSKRAVASISYQFGAPHLVDTDTATPIQDYHISMLTRELEIPKRLR